MPPWCPTRPLIRATPSSRQQEGDVAGLDMLQRQAPPIMVMVWFAGVAADAGDDGHQGRQRHQLGDGVLEQTDHPRRHEGGAGLMLASQAQRVLTALETGRTSSSLADPPIRRRVGVALLIDQAHHLGDGEPSHQLALASTAAETRSSRSKVRRRLVVVFRIEGDRILLIASLTRVSGLCSTAVRAAPLQPVAPVGDEQLVGVLGILPRRRR